MPRKRINSPRVNAGAYFPAVINNADLRSVGWFPGRKVNIEEDVAALARDGIEGWPALWEFLEEFSGLAFRGHASNRTLSVDAKSATAGIDPRWGEDYGRELGVSLAPVGQHSMMTLFLGADGNFYGGFGAEYGRLGASFQETLDGVLNHEPVLKAFDLVLGE